MVLTKVLCTENFIFLTEFTYTKLMNDVKMTKMTTKKKPRYYWLLKLYDVMTVENKSKLMYPDKVYKFIECLVFIHAGNIYITISKKSKREERKFM